MSKKIGIICASDTELEPFIKAEKREEINQKLRPLSVDMETASVAHTCYVNQIGSSQFAREDGHSHD